MKECENKVTKNYQQLRAFNSLSTNHYKRLLEIMKEIDEWVYDANSDEKLVYQIQSYSLKKAIAK